MAFGVNIVLILPAPLFIHYSAIPVAVFRLALRSPMCPNAEFGVTEPFRTLIRGQTLGCRAVRPFRNGLPGTINYHLIVRGLCAKDNTKYHQGK